MPERIPVRIRTGYYVASRDWPPVGNDIPLADIYRALEAITQADVDAALRSLRHPVQEEPMPDTTESTGRVAAFLDDVQMQAEDHHLVPAADPLRFVAALRHVFAAHRDVGGRCSYCRNQSGQREKWPCGEYLTVSRALLGEDGDSG